MTYFATDFQNVDGAGAAQAFVQCLRLQQSLEFYRSYKQKTRDLLALKEGARVLEVGCGTGEDAEALAREVGASGQVFAVDLSTELLGVARETVLSSRLPVRLIQADARSLPFADSSLDGARIDRTLQHIVEPLQVLAEMSRVLRSGHPKMAGGACRTG
jgi:ubiquinone/menaquinone biosynthesis C-methylase UbiE